MIIDLYSIIANFKIIENAFGYTLGLTSYNLIQSFFKSILVPLLDTFFDRDLSAIKITFGSTELLIGKFIESFIDFIIVLGFILFILRVLLYDVVDDIIQRQKQPFVKKKPIKIVKKPIEKLEVKKEEEQEMPKQTQLQQPPPPPQIQPMNHNQHNSSVYSSINGGVDSQSFNSSGIVPYNI